MAQLLAALALPLEGQLREGFGRTQVHHVYSHLGDFKTLFTFPLVALDFLVLSFIYCVRDDCPRLFIITWEIIIISALKTSLVGKSRPKMIIIIINSRNVIFIARTVHCYFFFACAAAAEKPNMQSKLGTYKISQNT